MYLREMMITERLTYANISLSCDIKNIQNINWKGDELINNLGNMSNIWRLLVAGTCQNSMQLLSN